jgi:hypothetical protein
MDTLSIASVCVLVIMAVHIIVLVIIGLIHPLFFVLLCVFFMLGFSVLTRERQEKR